MKKEEILKALIMKERVDQNYLSKEQLSGINCFLDELTLDTLKEIINDLEIDYE